MKCANPSCDAETLYLRSGGIYAVDFLTETGEADEGRGIQRRVIWLCDACTGRFAVETWRPPGEQMRPTRSGARRVKHGEQQGVAEAWS